METHFSKHSGRARLRRHFFATAGILLALGLGACGGGDPEFNEGPAEQNSSGAPQSSAPSSSPDATPPGNDTGNTDNGASSSAPIGEPSSSAPATPTAPSFDVQQANHLYDTQCATCHGDQGSGGLGGNLTHCTTCDHTASLVRRIADSMPVEDPSMCGEDCAQLLAQFIQSDFPKTGSSASSEASSNGASSSSSQSDPVIVPGPGSSSSASSAPAHSSSSVPSSTPSSSSSVSSSVPASSSSVSVSSEASSTPSQSSSSSQEPSSSSSSESAVSSQSSFSSEESSSSQGASEVSSSSVSSSASSESSASSVESSSSASEESSSSEQSSSSSQSSSDAPQGSIAQGQERYENGCLGCHGADGNGLFKIDPTKSEYQHSDSDQAQYLTAYIETWMPVGAPSTCQGQCAADLAAYIQSWANGNDSSSSQSSVSSSESSASSDASSVNPPDEDSSSSATSSSDASSSSEPASSSAPASSSTPSSASSASSSTPPYAGGPDSCDIAYGPRTLRVLTRSEYVNAVRDLTGIDVLEDLGRSVYDNLPADNVINGFSNNVMASIESGALQSYNLVANKIVEALAANDFQSVVDCTGMAAEQCGAELLDDFGFRIFRRPLSDDERVAFQQMLSAEYSGGELNEGLALVLRTMLTSPHFLYRNETGLSVEDLENGVEQGPDYAPSGEVTDIIGDGESERLTIYNRTAQDIEFTGDNLIEIDVSATQSATGLWPSLRLEIDNEVYAQVLVDHGFTKTYRFRLEDLSGRRYTAIINQQTGAEREYEGGHDLIITGLRVSGVQLVEAEVPDEPLDPDAYVLTPYELASFLSFTFAGTTPDLELLNAARSGQLKTDAQIEAQVDRLLDTPHARRQFGDLAAQWLRTDRVLQQIKDPELYPGFTDEVREAMAQEVREVFNHVVLDEGEPFTALYDGDFTFANGVLADFYGLSGVHSEQMQKVEHVDSRAGLVTSGAFLTVHAHEKETAPILRATYARRAFLCHDVPAPPTGISLSGEDVDALREEQIEAWEAYLEENNGVATSRRKYDFQTSAPLCQTCHEKMINPLGFGFEDYDAVGLPQLVDYNNLMVEFDGALHGVDRVDDGQVIHFEGAKEFAHAIAELDVTRQCFIDNMFRLAMGTGANHFDYAIPSIALSSEERASYSCEANRLDQVMIESDYSPRELLKAIGSMDSVRYRKNVTR